MVTDAGDSVAGISLDTTEETQETADDKQRVKSRRSNITSCSKSKAGLVDPEAGTWHTPNYVHLYGGISGSPVSLQLKPSHRIQSQDLVLT